MSMSDADVLDDEANYVMTQWVEGERPDNVAAVAEYPCGCKATRIHTAAGWQWDRAGDCPDATHKVRAEK